MRLLASFSLAAILATTFPGCKARQNSAQVRNDDVAADATNLDELLSRLASGLREDLKVYYADEISTGSDAFALDDAPKAKNSDADFEAFKKRLDDVAAKYRAALTSADNSSPERRKALEGMNDKLERAMLALESSKAPEASTYQKGLTELEKVVDSMQAADSQNRLATFSCPAGYVAVPGDGNFETKDFCVMKYEAKKVNNQAVSQASGFPWGETTSRVSLIEAKAKCEGAGAGYALINNNEWMTIATNIASTAENWSLGRVGDGSVNAGNITENTRQAGTDDHPCKNLTGCNEKVWDVHWRTHKLSNKSVIWDFSGNICEVVDYYNASTGKLGENLDINKVSDTEGVPLSAIRPTQGRQLFWKDSWGRAQGFGTYTSRKDSNSVCRGGGSWTASQTGNDAGIFAFAKIWTPDARASQAIRCVFHPKS